VSRPRAKPTAKSIQRQVTRLLHDLAAVYSAEGHHAQRRTNEHGTLELEWRDGRVVLNEKPEGGSDEHGG
jgi:hypothetical protein